MNRLKARIAVAAAVLIVLVFTSSDALDPIGEKERQILASQIEELKLPRTTTEADVDPALLHATGSQEVIVTLKSSSVAMMANEMSQPALMEHKAMVKNEQVSFMERTGTTAKEIACVQTLLNAVFLNIDAAQVVALASDPDVVSIYRVKNYEMKLAETVPYIGATAVQNEGYDGTGIRVAVLDSGIDYTHAAFGGDGTLEAYDAAYTDPASRDGLFPTEKVVEGFDFVGEYWPQGPLIQDDDPIDFFSHGTSVADILGGNDGVAPGVSLYAVKVCSAFASACNGIALIQGMEYAVDPNGDGDISDAVDVINLSIGMDYGQPFDDSVSQAVNAASELGVLVVASAGNGGDRPYITGTSSSAGLALSVANTRVPSASLQVLTVNDGMESFDFPAVFQPWAEPLDGILVGPIQYGDGQGGNLDGCLDYESESLVGKVVLVDRGVCTFTLKTSNISRGGGLAGIIGLIAEGQPFLATDGGERPTDVPAFMISQADADATKATLPGGTVTMDPDNVIPIVMTMETSSSRGPQHEDTQLIKPEICAPGSSVAAVAGQGTGTRPFGGTSGASPMVAGSAALLLQKYPFLTPPEVKARLMNNGETNIDTDFNLGFAPITRIGGGEVRVDKALTARAAAWDEDTLQGALSFGFIDVYKESHQLFKRILIRNYSDDVITYTITPTFRYKDDEASGAVSVETVFPGAVRLGPREDGTISVVMTIIGDRLSGNFMNSGSQGDDGDSLTMNEFDGYLILDDGIQPIHMAWHVLPRRAANVVIDAEGLDFAENSATVGLVNTGVGVAQIDSYALLAVSGNLPEGGLGEERPTPDIRAVGIKTLEDIPEGVCTNATSFIWQFAISTWERQQHLFPVRHLVFLDMDQNGTDDYIVLNSDFVGVGIGPPFDGRQGVFSLDRQSDAAAEALLFAEHSTNTGNTMLSVCSEQIGLNQTDLRVTNINMRVETLSFYGGSGDEVGGLTVTPGAERYVASNVDLEPGQTGTISVTDRGAFEGNSAELGIMLFTNGDRGAGNRGGATEASELLLVRA